MSSAPSPVTTWTFTESKKEAAAKVRVLAMFAESAGNQAKDAGLKAWSRTLTALATKIDGLAAPSLSPQEVAAVRDFALALAKGILPVSTQLIETWSIIEAAVQSMKPGGAGYAVLGVFMQNKERIARADNLAFQIVQERTGKPPGGATEANALLLAHLIRVETIEYVHRRQLDDMVKTFALTGYDVELACSVGGKVPWNGSWETDVRAVRDATAHAHYKVTTKGNDWEVEFVNSGHGYKFKETFSRAEFLQFLDNHTMLTKTQTMFLLVVETLNILATNLAAPLPQGPT